MKVSNDVKNAMLGFYSGVTNKEVERFDDLVSKDATLIFGTAPGENVTERAGMRFGFEMEGLSLKAGKNPAGYEEGTMGWAVDEPTFGFPDGSKLHIRLTIVMRKEDGKWKIVHGHFSVGVPDDQVVLLQKQWAKAA